MNKTMIKLTMTDDENGRDTNMTITEAHAEQLLVQLNDHFTRKYYTKNNG